VTHAPAPAADHPIRWRGRPVPYVTQWTGEMIDPRDHTLRIDTWTGPAGTLVYDDGQVTDRDRHGVLWMRYGSAAGDGEPMWRWVHVGRQRQAMRQLRCQVCATPLDRERTPWLIPAAEWALITAGTQPQATSTPPCCEDCWDIARRACPHLARQDGPGFTGWLHRPRRWGVRGDVYEPIPGGRKHDMRLIADNSPSIPFTLAKQLAITWDTVEQQQ
jgi:hypothetical protein